MQTTNYLMRSFSLNLLLLSLLSISACSTTDSKKYITADELSKQLDNKQLIIVDTRTRREYEKDHIPNAQHIPFWKTAFTTLDKEDCSDKTVVLYCEHGPRAHMSYIIGFCQCKDVKILQGHMVGWRHFQQTGNK